MQSYYEQAILQDPFLPFPFWTRIWPSARALTMFLESNPGLIENKTVLELGAGIGLPAFSIANKARSVLVSDHDPQAVALMELNIAWLQLQNVKAGLIDWNHFPEGIVADTILLSDINYAPGEFESLRKLMRQWLEQGSTIVLATPQRISAIPFVEGWASHICTSEVITLADGNRISILLLSSI